MLDSSQIDFSEEAIRAELGAMVQSKILSAVRKLALLPLGIERTISSKAEDLKEYSIDRTSMFEEIVGSSKPMSQVLNK